MAWTTRKSLIERVLDGDEESWDTFYGTYSRLICAIGNRSGLSSDDCQDLTQDVMRTIFDHKDRFNYDAGAGKFRSYLTGIVKHKIGDFYRSRDKRVFDVNSESDDETEDPNNRLDAICEEEWRSHLFNVALMDLRQMVEPGTFDAFQMYVLQELDPKVVAKALSISESSVYVYKNRCVSHLRKIIERYRLFDPEFAV